MSNTVIDVKNFSVSFKQYGRGLKSFESRPIEDLNVSMKEGEIHAIVGASGSGKSLLAHGIIGILPTNAKTGGKIYYRGEELTEERKIQLRGREIALIPQSVNHLDPTMKVKNQVQIGLGKDRVKIQESLFERYGLEKEAGMLFPHQLSGGMLRRVLFATSIRDGVRLIIADEPTPGVHPEILGIMLDELRRLADKGVSIMLISHDISSVLTISDRVTVFKDGRDIETAPTSSFSGRGEKLKTNYARDLWNALPANDFIMARGI